MLIKCLPVGHLMTNCYIVTDETTLECAVIDPGDESNTILYYLEDNHLTCRAILLTHGHYDHTGAVYAVHEETGAPVYMNALDAGTAVAFDSYSFVPPEGTIFYKEGDEVKVGNLTFRVMETPGHTPGGVTLICGDALFTGDTLFNGSCGRTDFEPIVKDTTPNMMNPRLYTTSYNKPQGQQFDDTAVLSFIKLQYT